MIDTIMTTLMLLAMVYQVPASCSRGRCSRFSDWKAAANATASRGFRVQGPHLRYHMNDSLSQLLRQEEELQFTSFTDDDAWAIGSLFIERVRTEKLGVSIDISTKDKVLFHYSFVGRNPDNEPGLSARRIWQTSLDTDPCTLAGN
ncbi:MAG TPA: hypothetical protein PKO22_01930 [Treponemataceae bacterium]|nr:hypothetical protein [Treponemataceae bacterium]